MFNLIRKDLLQHKWETPLYVSVFVAVLVLQAWRGFSASLYITLTCTYAMIFPAVFITLEDRCHTEPFNCSLPVTRTQIVHARYAICWALAGIVVLVGLLLYSTIAARSFGAIWTMSTGGQALVTLSLGLGITLPFLLRWGWWGFVGGFVATQSLWLAVVLAIQVFAPDVQLGNTFIAIGKFVANTRTHLGGPLFLTTIVVGVAVFNLISCRIAAMLFNRREF
ncbi:MAG: ABC-2 transporter permease [Fuerstiella sp.]|nr:ABC-2 transporter permease [Fuerstiella sp.]MCP4858378.1 ABC-2 transporter permease [Fuerstiella sp.]